MPTGLGLGPPRPTVARIEGLNSSILGRDYHELIRERIVLHPAAAFRRNATLPVSDQSRRYFLIVGGGPRTAYGSGPKRAGAWRARRAVSSIMHNSSDVRRLAIPPKQCQDFIMLASMPGCEYAVIHHGIGEI